MAAARVAAFRVGGAARRRRRLRAPRAAGGSAGGPPSVVARWSVDARFGRKGDALELLKEWASAVAPPAAAPPRLRAAALGAPESRLELELEFTSLADLERFFAELPFAAHKEWGGRFAEVVIDGTPRWEVFTALPVAQELAPAQPPPAAAPAPSDEPESLLDSLLASADPEVESLLAGANADAGAASSKAEELAEEAPRPPGTKVVLDWKGDPMEILPGDKLPFFGGGGSS